jgi:hypothetical protein
MVEQSSGPHSYPPMPAAPEPVAEPARRPPRLVPVAAVLLMVNLALSVLVTVLSFVYRDDIVRMTLEQSHSQAASDVARQAVITSLWVRAGVNVLVGLLYLFFISRLYRGKRWAWRRLVWLSLAGCAGMIFLLTQHYPVIFKVEQVLQLLVLAAIAVCVLHPETRAHYAKRR